MLRRQPASGVSCYRDKLHMLCGKECRTAYVLWHVVQATKAWFSLCKPWRFSGTLSKDHYETSPPEGRGPPIDRPTISCGSKFHNSLEYVLFVLWAPKYVHSHTWRPSGTQGVLSWKDLWSTYLMGIKTTIIKIKKNYSNNPTNSNNSNNTRTWYTAPCFGSIGP